MQDRNRVATAFQVCLFRFFEKANENVWFTTDVAYNQVSPTSVTWRASMTDALADGVTYRGAREYLWLGRNYTRAEVAAIDTPLTFQL